MKKCHAEGGNVPAIRQLSRAVCLFLCSLFLLPCNAADSIALEISKSERTLKVRRGDTVLKHYEIAFGKGGRGGKRMQGDNKTPVGIYRIMDFKQDSKFHYFMQINYPNLTDAWHGYMGHLITGTEFREIAAAYRYNELPPQNTLLGGYIGIHGIGRITGEKLDIHTTHNWTEGCIALKNEEINELRQYVSIGTPVVITE